MGQPARNIKSKTAGINQLFEITGSWSENLGVSALPLSVRPWVYWLTAVLKLGYDQIKAPVWAITKSHHQSCARTTCSASSTRRALKWLGENGYIYKRTFRVGPDCRGVIIDIDVDRFKFFLRQKKPKPLTSVVVKHDEMSDTSLRQSPWQGDNVTSKDALLLGSNKYIVSKGIKSKNNANKINKNNDRKKHTRHPVIYTLWVITRFRRDCQWIQERARRSLSLNNGADGIDWDYWNSERWLEMSHEERESHCAREIWPKLKQKQQTTKPDENLPNINDVITSICTPEKSHDRGRYSPPQIHIPPGISDSDAEIIIEQQKRLLWLKKTTE